MYEKVVHHGALHTVFPIRRELSLWLWGSPWIPVIFTICLGVARFDKFQVGSNTDDAWYTVMATALARGLGYVRMWTPGLMPETNLPVGYPLLLAPLRWAFPDTFVPLQMLSLVAAVGIVILCYVYYSRRLEQSLAWLITLLLAVHVAFVGSAVMVMTEAPYTLLSIGMLILIDILQESDRRRSIARYFLVGLLGTSACLVRGWGIALMAAAVVYFLGKHRWREMVGLVVPFAALYGLWSARNVSLGGTMLSNNVGPTTFVSVVQQLNPDQNPINKVLIQWVQELPELLIPLIFGPKISNALQQLGLGFAPWMIGGIVLLTVVAGYLLRIRKGWTLAEVYTPAYVALLALAPLDATKRYLVPLLPLLLYYFAVGLQHLASFVSHRFGWRGIAKGGSYVVLAMLVVLHLGRNVQEIRNPLRNRIPDVALGAGWIARNTPSDAVVMALIPRVTYLYAQRVTVPFPDGGGEIYDAYPGLVTAESSVRFQEAIERYSVDYILVEPILKPGIPFKWSSYIRDEIVPVLEQEPSRFRLVFADDSGLIRVYQVLERK
jgi:hypothetical protein